MKFGKNYLVNTKELALKKKDSYVLFSSIMNFL